MRRRRRARTPHPRGRRARDRRWAALTGGTYRTRVIAHAPASLPHAAERDPLSTTARVGVRRRIGPAATGAVVARRVVVVAQAEEPDEPHDQQADVEYAEADHEDPSLGGHKPMVPLPKEKVKSDFGVPMRSWVATWVLLLQFVRNDRQASLDGRLVANAGAHVGVVSPISEPLGALIEVVRANVGVEPR